MIQKDGVDIEMLPDDWKRTGHVIQTCDFFAEKVFSCSICNGFADFSLKPSSDNDIQLMVYSIRE